MDLVAKVMITPEDIRFVRGDSTGVQMPACPASMAKAPAEFLTLALRSYGALPHTARVAAVTRCEEVQGGNSGKKMLLDVVYEGASTELPVRLFAKFSRDFDDPFRDRRRGELKGEVQLAKLSRLPQFPIAVARPLFADFEQSSGTGLLITERLNFGTGTVEPLWPKCMDHLIPDALGHYRALVSAQARLAAAYQTGKLSPHVDELFPLDRDAAEADLPIMYDATALTDKIAAWCDFISEHPQLFPPALRTAAWRKRLSSEAHAILANQSRIRAFLQSDHRFIALCHWNANVDNAWFWPEPDGTLACGLLDWGMVRPMNVATGLWGGLSASTLEFLSHHLSEMLAHYCKELSTHGGACIAPAELELHFNLALAIIGLSLMMDFPSLARARMPDMYRMTGLLDPMLARDKVVQGFLVVSTNFLSLWQQRDFAGSLACAITR